MEKTGCFTRVVILAGILLLSAGGCTTVTPPRPQLVCGGDVISSLGEKSSEEVEYMLDEAWGSGSVEECWVPMLKYCLDHRITIPHRHAKYAVKRFNRVQYSAYFNKAVARYFNEMVFGTQPYRPQDRELLIAFIRYSLENCASRDCRTLQTAKQVCSRLDADLYGKFFE